MPRSNREYLLRYCDQAQGNLENALERLKMLSDAYGGVWKPLDGDITVQLQEEPTNYDGLHGKYQEYVDLQAALIMTVMDNLKIFKQNYM